MEKINVKDVENKSRERIIYLIDNMCSGNRMDFANKSGIGKSSVSQYVNGTNTPGNITASKIGKAFNVNPMWVMGFDEPMRLPAIEEENGLFSPEKKELMSISMDLLAKLNDDELKEVIKHMEFTIFRRNI